jgi:uncharacterized protein YoxC
MIIEICVSAVSVAFIVLVAFAVRTLHVSQKAILQANTAMQRTQLRIDEAAEQSLQWLRLSTELIRDIQRKLDALDVFIDSVGHLSAGVEHAGKTVRQLSLAVSRSVENVQKTLHHHRDAVAEAVELATAGYQLWQRWQAHRRPERQSTESGTTYEGAE